MEIGLRFGVNVYLARVRVYRNFDRLVGLLMTVFELCACTWLLPNTHLEWNKRRADQGGQALLQRGTLLRRSCLTRCWEAFLFRLVNVPEGLLKDLLFLNPSQQATTIPSVGNGRTDVFGFSWAAWFTSTEVSALEVNMLEALCSPFLSIMVRFQRNIRHILGFQIPYNLVEFKCRKKT